MTVREVLLLAGKLHHAVYKVWPGRFFVHRLLWLADLHLTEVKLRGGGGDWGSFWKNINMERIVEQTPEFIVDKSWWRWFVHKERWKRGKRLTAPFL